MAQQKIGLAIDASCDLPTEFLEQNNILVIPYGFRIGKQFHEDSRAPLATREIYQKRLHSKSHDVETIPYTSEQIKELLLKVAVTNYDSLLVVTATSTRNPYYQNSTKATHQIFNDYRDQRRRAGLQGPFSVRVIDSRSVFSGSGLVAAEGVRLIAEGVNKNELRQRLENFSQNVFSLMVIPDVYYMRERARKWGDKSIGLMASMLNRALNIVPIVAYYRGEPLASPVATTRGFESSVRLLFELCAEEVKSGLLSQTVCISYAGDEDAIKMMPGYDEFARVASQHGVQLLVSSMAVSGGGVNVGPGALNIALATQSENLLHRH